MQEISKDTVLQSPTPTMIVKTGLLIVSSPKHIGKTLQTMKNCVHNTLYIQLLSALTDPVGSFYPNIFNTWPKFNHVVRGIYAEAANHCKDLDVKILLSNLKYSNYIKTKRPIELVIFDTKHPTNDIDNFIKHKIGSIASGYDIPVLLLDIIPFNNSTCDADIDDTVYNHTVIGGTFDRFHIAHKLLLTEALLRAKTKITVGVTEENMLDGKMLKELIEPISKRVNMVKEFIDEVDPEIEQNVVPISDPFGPAKDDPTIDAIIVSEETVRGGQKINELRSSIGLTPLKIHILELIEDPNADSNEELKISSSSIRMRLLGTLLKPIQPNKAIPDKPRVIGLTGGIASGKTGIAKRLRELGAEVIDCDKLAHKLYEPGKLCYQRIIDAFGESIVAENGEINRRVLGGLVFKDPQLLQKLNSLVWPAMMEDIQQQISESTCNVVVIDAAVLLLAGWEKNCHEVWTTIIPQNEAVKRIQERNKLTEEDAKARIASQLSNKQYVDAANVVFCSFWPSEYTRTQVDRAWKLLQTRISS